MTRIKCVDVTELVDQHLLAEYREITRVSKLARPLPDYGVYKMGAGHVKFFYNKGAYLQKRTKQLYNECIARGFKVELKEYPDHAEGLHQDWEPKHLDLSVNNTRLVEKISAKPNFYKFWRQPLKENKNDKV